MKNLGILLKKLRTDANLTQEDFASKLNTSKSTVSKWENGSSTPDTETILRLSHLFAISCDDLLHPTETLTKMTSVANMSISDQCEESSNETFTEEDSAHVIEPDSRLTPRYFIFTPKKLLLLCMPILILGITIGVIFSRTVNLNSTVSAVQDSDKTYTFMEARNDVETIHGNAYELVYHVNSGITDEELSRHADSLANDWRSGTYTDSTEHILIVSYYLSDDTITNDTSVHFRATYLN